MLEISILDTSSGPVHMDGMEGGKLSEMHKTYSPPLMQEIMNGPILLKTMDDPWLPRTSTTMDNDHC